jgi:Na+-translocating ferredoxin:NAD+ oxidoreductase RnfG subunit
MKKFNFTLLFAYGMLVAIVLLTAYSLFQAKYSPAPMPAPTTADLSKPEVDPLIKSLVPEAVEVQQVSQNPWVIKIVKNDGSYMYGASGKGEGHQSEISVLLIMSPDHKIASVAIISQGETPSKFKKLESNNFLSQFNNKDINDGFVAGKNIDTVTGATNSSKGVTAAVANAAESLKSIH